MCWSACDNARQAAPETFSPVQRVLWHSRPAAAAAADEDGSSTSSGIPVIHTPEQCDHSPISKFVDKNPAVGGGGRAWHRGKGRGGGKKRKIGHSPPEGGCQVGSPEQKANAEESGAAGGCR